MLLTVDSSAIITSLLDSEKYHEECERLMDKIFDATHNAVLPYSVLVEVAGSLKRRTALEDFAEKAMHDLENAVSIYFIELTKDRAREAASIAKETGLKGMDAIVVQAARQNGAILVTLDGDIIKKAKNIINAMSVSDFLKIEEQEKEHNNKE